MDFDNRQVYGDTSITDGLVAIFIIMVIIILIITTLEYRPPQPNDNARPSRQELLASSAVYLFYQDQNIFL